MIKQPSYPSTPARASQQGAALLFALLTLVAMLVATLGLVRAVDTGTVLLGNIGFKQDATASAEQASRAAIQWLTLHKSALNSDIISDGYYASNQEFAPDGVTAAAPVDATGGQLSSNTRQLIDWDNNDCESTTEGTYTSCTIKTASAGTINGNEARYVIFRLCSKVGDAITDTSINCAKPMITNDSTATGRGFLDYSNYTRYTSATGPYYRVVVRALGARNTASFTETIVHF